MAVTSAAPVGVRRARPRRLWYLVAVLVPACALAASLVVPALTRGGDIGQPLALDQPVTVDMVSSYERVVWAKQTGSRLAEVTCQFADDPRLVQSSVGHMAGPAVEIEADGHSGVV
ncbi:hypothetical protein GCM10027575_65260 [Phytohabitans suffuscus]